jgi:hypothetical protein
MVLEEEGILREKNVSRREISRSVHVMILIDSSTNSVELIVMIDVYELLSVAFRRAGPCEKSFRHARDSGACPVACGLSDTIRHYLTEVRCPCHNSHPLQIRFNNNYAS